jgi:hypothetical protein
MRAALHHSDMDARLKGGLARPDRVIEQSYRNASEDDGLRKAAGVGHSWLASAEEVQVAARLATELRTH